MPGSWLAPLSLPLRSQREGGHLRGRQRLSPDITPARTQTWAVQLPPGQCKPLSLSPPAAFAREPRTLRWPLHPQADHCVPVLVIRGHHPPALGGPRAPPTAPCTHFSPSPPLSLHYSKLGVPKLWLQIWGQPRPDPWADSGSPWTPALRSQEAPEGLHGAADRWQVTAPGWDMLPGRSHSSEPSCLWDTGLGDL